MLQTVRNPMNIVLSRSILQNDAEAPALALVLFVGGRSSVDLSYEIEEDFVDVDFEFGRGFEE